MTNDDHGKGHAGVDEGGKAITDKTFEAAGKAFDMDTTKAKENAHELLMKKVKS